MHDEAERRQRERAEEIRKEKERIRLEEEARQAAWERQQKEERERQEKEERERQQKEWARQKEEHDRQQKEWDRQEKERRLQREKEDRDRQVRQAELARREEQARQAELARRAEYARQREMLEKEEARLKQEVEKERKKLVEDYTKRKNHELENQEKIGAVLMKDVIGLDAVKVQVVAFDDINQVQNIFAFGPPGCGKTFISKAIATSLQYEYVTVEASNLLALNSEQSCDFLKNAFKIARSKMASSKRPCILFFDEFDTIVVGKDKEALYNTLCVELDGLASNAGGESQIMCVAITNRPWDINDAVRRRFNVHYYFPLPTPIHRRMYIEKYMSSHPNNLSESDLQEFIRDTNLYSFKELRDVVMNIEAKKAIDLASTMRTRASLSRPKPTQEDVAQVVVDGKILRYAVKRVRPQVVVENIPRYEAFTKEFGLFASDEPEV